MTIDDLMEAVIPNYQRLGSETQLLLPLKRIYWPASAAAGTSTARLRAPQLLPLKRVSWPA